MQHKRGPMSSPNLVNGELMMIDDHLVAKVGIFVSRWTFCWDGQSLTGS